MKEKWFLIIKSISYIFAVLMFMYSFAAIASDFHSPRTIALGGAGHAGPLLNDAIFLNPSFASFLPTYSFGFNYLSFANQNDIGDKGRILNVSIQDGRSEVFQAGAAYTQKSDGSYLHVGASKNFVNRFGFGIGGKFFFNS
ncbi:MAG: hypothetical protein HY843_06910, partial [Bdellovibrio sp.]|nr:hypothetical protein [Bdellovibrio sp.]